MAYILRHVISNNSIEKNIVLRYHGQKPEIRIVEPFVQNNNTHFKKIDSHTIEILGGAREFIFELLSDDCTMEMGMDEERYKQPFPALKGFPLVIKVLPDAHSFMKKVNYRISIKK